MPLLHRPPAPAFPAGGFVRGSTGYRRAGAALCAAGAGTFTLLYATQALLPLLARDFGVSPTTASLSLSLATGALALSLLPASAVAARWGTARVMRASLAAAAILGLLAPLAPTFGLLLVARTLQGALMAGVPALAMAYLAREVHARSLGAAMGLLVAGNTMGGLSGRVVSSVVADIGGWRLGLAAVGLVSLACLAAFWWLLPDESPPGRGERVAPVAVSSWGHIRAHLRDPGLRRLFALSFVLMSAFVTVYNYLPFRLLREPFGLSQTVLGLIFLGYLAGTLASTVAGRLADRVGRHRILWGGVLLAQVAVLLTTADHLAAVLTGLALFTVGFFGAHTAASGWVGRRASSGGAQASSLYLLAYYAGSSIGGSATGVAFAAAGWPGIVAVVSGLLAVALVLGAGLRGLAPAPPPPDPRAHAGQVASATPS
jgi:YNFM family putative membrane transporter